MNPFLLVLVLFIIVPIFEIFLLIKVGGVIGALPTIFLILLTALVGTLLLRQQGIATITRFQTTLARGEMPATELLEGVLLLLGGALLLTPGFFTDAVGFLCLLPPSRKAIIAALWSRIILPTSMQTRHSSDYKGRVIEGEIIKKRDESS